MRRKSEVFIIGAGRVGRTFAQACMNAAHISLIGVYDTSLAQLENLPSNIKKVSTSNIEHALHMASMANMLLFAVQDSQIHKAAIQWNALLKRKGISFSNACAIHMSGALPSSKLEALKENGFYVASLHPIVSFSNDTSPEVMNGAFAAMEGDEPAMDWLHEFCEALGMNCFRIDAANKVLYHAAAVMVSNMSAALADAAFELGRISGMPDEAIFAMAGMLMGTTADRLLSGIEPENAQFGPFLRADVEVIESELAALSHANPLLARIYALLGKRLVDMSQRVRNELPADERILQSLDEYVEVSK